MKFKTFNSLGEYRKRLNIPLHDIAFIADMDIGNLSKMERGIREPNAKVMLLYHTLFEAPLHLLFPSKLSKEKEGWKVRSADLVELLKEEQPPQSSNRIKFVQAFVNKLTKEKHEPEE